MNYLQRKKRAIISAKQQGILPLGYRQVEYLKSTGTQYIDTGVMYETNKNFNIELDIISTQDIYPSAAGSGWNAGGGLFALENNPYWSNGFISSNFFTLTTRINCKINININGTTYYTYSSGSMDFYDNRSNNNISTYARSGYPLFISTDSRGNFIYPIKAKIYNAKIKVDDTEIRNLIPCIDNNNRPCMYDTVSKQTFYNQGTGEFLYGEVIN